MALTILSVRLIRNDYVLLRMIEWKADFSGNLGRKARYYDDIKTKQHPILRLLLPVATVVRERTKRKLELRFSQTRMSQTQISLTVFVVASVTKVQHLWYVRGCADKKQWLSNYELFLFRTVLSVWRTIANSAMPSFITKELWPHIMQSLYHQRYIVN